MTSIVAPPANAILSDAIPYVWLHRLTVAQYHAMIAAGIVTPADRIELLEGLLVEKMGKKPTHSQITQIIRSLFERLLPIGWHVVDQEPLTTADSEPEPDIMIVRGTLRDYMDRHPAPPDVAVVIEVSDNTLVQDRTLKLRIYAAAGISVYWIVNLPDRQIECHSLPFNDGETVGYRERTLIRDDGLLSLAIVGHDLPPIPARELLP